MKKHIHFCFVFCLLLLVVVGCGQTTDAPVVGADDAVAADVAGSNDETEVSEPDNIDPEAQPAQQGAASSSNNDEPRAMAPSNQMSSGSLNMMGGSSSMMATDDAFVTTPANTDDLSIKEIRFVEQLASVPEIGRYLSEHPGWGAWAWEDDEAGVIWVDFYGDYEEWIGNGAIDVETGEITEYYVPAELSDAEYVAGKAAVEQLVFNDAEILGLVGNNFEDWYVEVDYDRWEQHWYVYLGKNIETWHITVYTWDEGETYVIGEIHDPQQLEADELAQWNRDQAIELTFEYPEIWNVLEGADEWQTYATPLAGSEYGVSVANETGELFFAVVDIDAWQIVDTTIPSDETNSEE